MKHIFVTGGTGFVGARICSELLRQGYKVTVGTRQSIVSLEYLPGANIAKLDYENQNSLMDAFQDVDIIIHLAAGNEIVCGQDPNRAIQENIQFANNVLEAAIATNVMRFINFSTAHIYGRLQGEITETTLPEPFHPYAITHFAFEQFVRAAHFQNTITGVNIRLSNSFGAPMHKDVDRWTLVANDLARQLAETRQLVLKSDGNQLRDFIGLGALVKTIIGFVEIDSNRLDNGVFNVGGVTLSIRDIAEAIKAVGEAHFGETVKVTYAKSTDSPKPKPLFYSTEKINQLGLFFPTDVKTEIEELCAFCFSNF